MRNVIVAILLLCQTYCKAQGLEHFSAFVMQGKDTLDITEGLKNYDPLRISWLNNTSEKLQTIEVHFGNGELPFSSKKHKVAKGQKLMVLDLQEFRAMEEWDIMSPRKREAEFSRIVVVFVMESSRYKSYIIPFKLPQ